MTPQFAVVRKSQRPYVLGSFKPTFDEAAAEAERLCRKERVPFMVVAMVAEVEPVEVPIKWERAFLSGFGGDD